MLRNLRYFIPLLVFIILVIFLWRGLFQDPHKIPSALIGKKTPVFSVADLLNPTEKITENIFIGHVSLLNVWATWCITCHAEQPVLMDIANSHSVFMVGLDYKDDPVAAQQWLQKYGNPYNTVINDQPGTLAINFGVYGTPETFIIDKQGIIRYKYIGAVSPDVWRDELLPEIKRWS